MSSEAWALVGVVIGAVSGGAIQVLADWLRRRHERASVRRVERREAYAAFLGAVAEALAPLTGARHALIARQAGSVPTEASRAALEAGQETLSRMSAATARVELCSPEDTQAAAAKVNGHLMTLLFADEPGAAEEIAKAQQEFGRLAKRDLQ